MRSPSPCCVSLNVSSCSSTIMKSLLPSGHTTWCPMISIGSSSSLRHEPCTSQRTVGHPNSNFVYLPFLMSTRSPHGKSRASGLMPNGSFLCGEASFWSQTTTRLLSTERWYLLFSGSISSHRFNHWKRHVFLISTSVIVIRSNRGLMSTMTRPFLLRTSKLSPRLDGTIRRKTLMPSFSSRQVYSSSALATSLPSLSCTTIQSCAASARAAGCGPVWPPGYPLDDAEWPDMAPPPKLVEPTVFLAFLSIALH
mmetsp:Transcript_114873/g.198999  ORF Transcript_114873/g.198999 Transcript_114873/m.198999 type:complete len:253 (-) Transcript_114873:6-764(-)